MIKIAVVSYDNLAPPAPIEAIFGPQRHTFGRSDDNYLVLSDPKLEVSRAQAALWSDGTRHTIINLSEATPIRVNGVEIEAGKETALQTGDQIQVGLYLLRAEAAAVPEAPATDALKLAFLRGAGIPADALSSGLSPELMELVGKLLASSLQGAIDLLALRSLVKQEVKADVTMVVVRNNNPLKFFPDSQTVLTQMLRKKMPGFMEAHEAVDDAYRDLCGHQAGVVAGTRASMEAVIDRLSPANLEAALKPAGMLDGLLPARRPAALWKRYTQQYDALAGEAQDQFKTLFGAAFLAAYEKEVERDV